MDSGAESTIGFWANFVLFWAGLYVFERVAEFTSLHLSFYGNLRLGEQTIWIEKYYFVFLEAGLSL